MAVIRHDDASRSVGIAVGSNRGKRAEDAQRCKQCTSDAFVATQLLMFREGRRKDAQMSPLAANLTNADLNDLAAYFAAQALDPQFAFRRRRALKRERASRGNLTACSVTARNL